MSLTNIAPTAQAEVERVIDMTGLPSTEFEVQLLLWNFFPNSWGLSISPEWLSTTEGCPVWRRRIDFDGNLLEPSEANARPLEADAAFLDACRARAVALAPEPEPFDADEAIFNSDALVPQGVVWTVGMNGALVVDGDIAQIVRRRLGGPVDAVTGLDRLISPRAVPPEHSVCVVFANGVYVAEPDDLTLPRTYYVCTPDQTHEIAKWEDAVQTAVALATQETQP